MLYSTHCHKLQVQTSAGNYKPKLGHIFALTCGATVFIHLVGFSVSCSVLEKSHAEKSIFSPI